MDWYYVDAGQQAGPVEETQLEELSRSGKIQPDTLVWHEGMTEWQPYSAVKPAGATAAAGAPLHPGRSRPGGAIIGALQGHAETFLLLALGLRGRCGCGWLGR